MCTLYIFFLKLIVCIWKQCGTYILYTIFEKPTEQVNHLTIDKYNITVLKLYVPRCLLIKIILDFNIYTVMNIVEYEYGLRNLKYITKTMINNGNLKKNVFINVIQCYETIPVLEALKFQKNISIMWPKIKLHYF